MSDHKELWCYTWLSLDHKNTPQIWYTQPILNSAALSSSSIHHLLSTDGTKILVSAFVKMPWLALWNMQVFLNLFFMWKCLCAILLYITFHLFIQSPFRLSQYLLNNKITLLTLSWEFPNLIRSLILLLSTGCLSIYKYSTNMLLYATAASTWLNSRQFTNQPTSLLLILPFSIFPLYACTHLIRDLFLMLHCLSRTVSHARLEYQTHSFRLSCWLSLSLNVCVHVGMLAEVCYDHVLFFAENGLCAEVWRNST